MILPCCTGGDQDWVYWSIGLACYSFCWCNLETYSSDLLQCVWLCHLTIGNSCWMVLQGWMVVLLWSPKGWTVVLVDMLLCLGVCVLIKWGCLCWVALLCHTTLRCPSYSLAAWNKITSFLVATIRNLTGISLPLLLCATLKITISCSSRIPSM